VSSKFDTNSEGWYVTLRDPKTDASLGNYPIDELGLRAKEGA
jgi:hypothetical protein